MLPPHAVIHSSIPPLANLSSSELKKLRNKQRRAERRAEAHKEEDKKKEQAQQKHDKNEDPENRPPEVEDVPSKLARVSTSTYSPSIPLT